MLIPPGDAIRSLFFWHYWNFLLGSSFNPLTLLRKSLPRIVRCHAWRRLSRTDLLYDFCLCDPAIVFLFVRFVGTCYDGQCMQEHSSLLQSHQWKVKEELSYSFFYNWNLFGSALFLLCMAPVVNYMLLLAPAAHIVRMFAEISSMVSYHSAPMTTDNLLTLCIPLQHVEKGAFDCCPFPAVKCSFFWARLDLTLDSTSLQSLISTMNMMNILPDTFMFGKIVFLPWPNMSMKN